MENRKISIKGLSKPIQLKVEGFLDNFNKTIRKGYNGTEIIIGNDFAQKEEVLELINKVFTPFNDQLWFGDIQEERYETGCKLTISKHEYFIRTELTED